MLALRSVIGYNDSIITFITEILKNFIQRDTVVKELKKESDIRNFFAYLLKDTKHTLENNFLCCNQTYQDYFSELIEYSNFYDLKLAGFTKKKQDEEILGLKKTENKFSNNTIVYIWNFYLTINNFYYFNSDFYKKTPKTLISFEKVFDKHFLVSEFDKIAKYLIINIPTQFKYLNFYFLKNQFLTNIDNKLDKIEITAINKIKPNHDLIEFIDGIYFIKFNKFLKKEQIQDIEDLDKKMNTIKYFNKTYHNLKEPVEWLKNIKKALNDNSENIDIICCYLANIFHKNKNIFQKKKVLYVYGESNTKKTTLIAKPLINFFDIKNIGFITGNLNFSFQEVVDKKVAILDEFKYTKKNKEQLLKLFAGEPVLIDIKFKNPEIVEEIPIIIISNELIKEPNKDIQKAFDNRIQQITFYKPDEMETKEEYDINEEIKKEEVNIIIHCNKIFFKVIKKYANEKENKTTQLTKYYNIKIKTIKNNQQ